MEDKSWGDQTFVEWQLFDRMKEHIVKNSSQRCGAPFLLSEQRELTASA